MTIKEIRAMKDEDLKAKLKDLKSELMNLRFQHTINQLQNPKKITDVRHDIAKVMTILREKEMKKQA